MNRKVLLGGLAVIALVLFAAFNLKKSVTPYVGFAEAKQAKAVVQVNGKLVKGSNVFDTKSQTLRFTISDGKGETLDVEYPKVPPANFEDSTGMVAIGTYDGKRFKADELLVKCPSKYEKKEKGK